ncbi:O-antigen ligase [Mangrovibacterium marinum]|nr:O-antigen ligase family protein [Mangrovibacterium marinum]
MAYKPGWRLTVILSNLFLLFFLFWQQSLTGIITLGVVVLVFLLELISRPGSQKVRIGIGTVLILILLIPSIYILKVIGDYYNKDQIDPNTLPAATAEGHQYVHDFSNPFTENGHYIGLYLCEDELKPAWNKRSAYRYQSADANGNRLSDTLVRYLTSKNLPKDASGIAALDEQDIQNIEAGISNYKLAGAKFSLYPRLYVSVWELDHFFKTGNSNHKSIAQRIEYLKAAWMIWRDNLWFGVGTGNWKEAYREAYQAMGSKMDESQYADAHNQYMAWLVRFGIVGTSAIIILLLWPVIAYRAYQSSLITSLLLIFFVANLGDSNLDTHAGGYLFLFFYALFLTNRQYLLSSVRNA